MTSTRAVRHRTHLLSELCSTCFFLLGYMSNVHPHTYYTNHSNRCSKAINVSFFSYPGFRHLKLLFLQPPVHFLYSLVTKNSLCLTPHHELYVMFMKRTLVFASQLYYYIYFSLRKKPRNKENAPVLISDKAIKINC